MQISQNEVSGILREKAVYENVYIFVMMLATYNNRGVKYEFINENQVELRLGRLW